MMSDALFHFLIDRNGGGNKHGIRAHLFRERHGVAAFAGTGATENKDRLLLHELMNRAGYRRRLFGPVDSILFASLSGWNGSGAGNTGGFCDSASLRAE